MNAQNRVLVIDGMAVLFRAYFASSYSGYIRKTSTGIPTNAIYGFIQYLFDAIHYVKPTHVLCCWDMGSTTFRNEWYSLYKANRSEPPEELVPQFELIKEVVAALPVRNYGVVGYEADDCIGTVAACLREDMSSHLHILTGDHDMLQLVSEQVTVIIMNKGKANYTSYTPQMLMEAKGITPQQIPDLKGFMGDSSDNYPGVRGIGEKTALKLVQEYQSVEQVLMNIEQLSASVSKKIKEQQDMLILCKKLATIRCDVPIDFQLEHCTWKLDKRTAQDMFEKLEMQSLNKLLE
jgi:5'-3' exonuclease